MIVSVIIPVFNVEKYLSRCIDSVLAQTYKDWELLLVDDGSTDDSGRICDEYAQIDSRIRVFHKENGGVGSARNLGIDEAIGDWISFVDSDDWVTSDYIENLIHTGHLEDDVLYSSGMVVHMIEGREWDLFTYEERCISLDNVEDVKTFRIFANGCPVAKLYNKSILNSNGLRFNTDFSFNEDHLFVIKYLCFVKAIYLIPFNNYYYWIDVHGNSLTHKNHDSYESLCASWHMHVVLSDFCTKYNCVPTDVVVPEDMQIFGAQQILRAIKDSKNKKTKIDILKKSMVLVQQESLEAKDYTGEIREVIEVLSVNNFFFILRYYFLICPLKNVYYKFVDRIVKIQWLCCICKSIKNRIC